MEPARLLLMLNEDVEGSHDDVRCALDELIAAGRLAAYRVYPFPARLAQGLRPREIAAEIIVEAADLSPTVVLWSHTLHLSVDSGCLERLRSLPSRPAMGYWDGDMYQTLCKPFPRQALELAQACDVVFLPGLNAFVHSLRRCGVKDIRYVPLTTDLGRFGGAFGMRDGRACEFDLAMIGNCRTSRLAFKTMPGLRWRIELAQMFEAKLGRRFAVFGHGWHGPCAQGPVEFAQQGAAYSTARFGVGNNNLRAAYYFSDRLPIAMSCGAVMLHNFEPGLREVLGAGSPVLTADDVDYQDERQAAREVASARLTMTHAQSYMLDVLGSVRRWRAGSPAAATVVNPWLGGEQLGQDRIVAGAAAGRCRTAGSRGQFARVAKAG